MAYLDTHYYGGIKKYQWVASPMALHGTIVKKDGTSVEISVGENTDEPVVGITDLLVHLSAKQMEKSASLVIEGEAWMFWWEPGRWKGEEKENQVKNYILKLLKDRYDIEEADFCVPQNWKSFRQEKQETLVWMPA